MLHMLGSFTSQDDSFQGSNLTPPWNHGKLRLGHLLYFMVMLKLMLVSCSWDLASNHAGNPVDVLIWPPPTVLVLPPACWVVPVDVKNWCGVGDEMNWDIFESVPSVLTCTGIQQWKMAHLPIWNRHVQHWEDCFISSSAGRWSSEITLDYVSLWRHSCVSTLAVLVFLFITRWSRVPAVASTGSKCLPCVSKCMSI